MNKVFTTEIGRNLKAYVDDILGGNERGLRNSNWLANLDHLEDTFDNLQLCNMRLNPKKCVFGLAKVSS